MALSLLLASCGEEGKPSYIPKPAVNSAGEYSSVQRDTIITPNDPSNDKAPEQPVDKEQDSNGLYWWERGRTVLPEFADMALCYGGHSVRNPKVWDKDRFEKTVIYKDKKGQEHWFFEAMLMLEIWDDNYNVTYSIANDGKDSSRKYHWTRSLTIGLIPDTASRLSMPAFRKLRRGSEPHLRRGMW